MENEFNLIETEENNADSRKKLVAVIEQYKSFHERHPNQVKALWKIGNLYTLLGAGHSTTRRSKKKNYKKAVEYCEQAMMLNPNFKQSIRDGNSIADSAKHLDENYLSAMGFWYTARFYYFRECFTAAERMFNVKLVMDNYKMISRIEELDPSWEGGGNMMSKAIYLIALPERFGGSKKRAEIEFEKAIGAGPNYIVNRWARAKYLHEITGNRSAFLEDLFWVLQQNPHKAGNSLPWNLYFQEQSRQMLASRGISFDA